MATLGPAQIPAEASVPSGVSTAPVTKLAPRHSALVRVTHWITALCFFALLVTGIEIVISHPRFYWGETGTVLTTPLFQLPIPSSRRLVPTGYGYVLPDQNGWSRALHFEAAWIAVLTGLLYVISGLLTRHFRKDLVPSKPISHGGRSLPPLQNRCALNGRVRQKLRPTMGSSASRTFL